MPHSINFSSFISAFKIGLGDIFKFLSRLIEWILYSFRIFAKIIIRQGHSIRIVYTRYVRIINNCIYIRIGWIKSNSDIVSRVSLLSALLSRLYFVFLKTHLLNFHYIIVFFLANSNLSIFGICFCERYSLLTFDWGILAFWQANGAWWLYLLNLTILVEKNSWIFILLWMSTLRIRASHLIAHMAARLLACICLTRR
jgi:hypothetical protein